MDSRSLDFKPEAKEPGICTGLYASPDLDLVPSSRRSVCCRTSSPAPSTHVVHGHCAMLRSQESWLRRSRGHQLCAGRHSEPAWRLRLSWMHRFKVCGLHPPHTTHAYTSTRLRDCCVPLPQIGSAVTTQEPQWMTAAVRLTSQGVPTRRRPTTSRNTPWTTARAPLCAVAPLPTSHPLCSLCWCLGFYLHAEGSASPTCAVERLWGACACLWDACRCALVATHPRA